MAQKVPVWTGPGQYELPVASNTRLGKNAAKEALVPASRGISSTTVPIWTAPGQYEVPVTLNTRRAKKAAKEAAAGHSEQARKAFAQMSVASLEQRNQCLAEFEMQLSAREKEIVEANEHDMNFHNGKALDGHISLNGQIGTFCKGVRQVQSMPDPLGCAALSRSLADGLNMYRTPTPLGVLMIISESSPEAAVETLSLAIKTGNAVILNGGSEATQTLLVLADAMRKSLAAVGLPEDALQLAAGHETARELLADGLVDLVIPRGSYDLVKWVQSVSTTPVLGQTGRRMCNVFVDETANPEMASSIIRELELQMGLDGLLNYKYQVHNKGQTVGGANPSNHQVDVNGVQTESSDVLA